MENEEDERMESPERESAKDDRGGVGTGGCYGPIRPSRRAGRIEGGILRPFSSGAMDLTLVMRRASRVSRRREGTIGGSAEARRSGRRGSSAGQRSIVCRKQTARRLVLDKFRESSDRLSTNTFSNDNH